MKRIKAKPKPDGNVTLVMPRRGAEHELATLTPQDALDLIKDLAAALEGRERREDEPRPSSGR